MILRTWTNNGKKWRILKFCQRFKADQSPKLFVVDAKLTYEIVEPGNRYHEV